MAVTASQERTPRCLGGPMNRPSRTSTTLIRASAPNARMINRLELGAPRSTVDEIAGTSNWVAMARGAIGSRNIQPTANKQHVMLRLQAIVSVWGGSQRRI